MMFWVRHLALILLCVCLPFAAALYQDTHSEIDRAAAVGATAARQAQKSLAARLTLESHRVVGEAIGLSHDLSGRQILRELERGGARATAAAETAAVLLRGRAPSNGFAWLLDTSGRVIARSDLVGMDPNPRVISHHPIFEETQSGFALDAIWRDGGVLAIMGGAPLVEDGHARGAVLVGEMIDKGSIEQIAGVVGADITLLIGDDVLVTTLPGNQGAVFGESIADQTEPVTGGTLSDPLTHQKISVLPLLVDHLATGYAYSSLATRALGDRSLTWVVSIRSGDALRTLAERQELILGGFVVAFMIALLGGLLNHHSFVRPIARVADHLSDLQLGRGEVELPESKVSRPFRRLVRLINMTVQKLPSRTLSPLGAPGGDVAQTSDMGPWGSGSRDLRDAPRKEKLADVLSQSVDLKPRPSLVPAPGASSSASMGVSGALFASADLAPSSDLGGFGAAAGRPPAEVVASSSAIADAIASLEHRSAGTAAASSGSSGPSATSATSAAARRSASAIRGKPMSAAEAMPPAPSPAEILRGGYPPVPDSGDVLFSSGSAARSGGSLADVPDLQAALERAAGLAQPAGQAMPRDGGGAEETVVAPVASDLLARSAREDITDMHAIPSLPEGPDSTVVSSVPRDLLARSAAPSVYEETDAASDSLDETDEAHFREVYEEFVEMRRRCGEASADLGFERFFAKLKKNRSDLVQKYNCRTVRFQVYEKEGKAALKATPIRAR